MTGRPARRVAVGVAMGIVLGLLTTVTGANDAAAGPAGPPRPRMVTVVVTMKQQADLTDVTGAGRRTRLRSLERTLRATAADGQRSITTRLDALAATGSVRDVVPLWVVDAVSVTATPGVVASLAARRDVASVVGDDIELLPASTVEPNVVTSNAPAVWARGDTGQGVVVATLDSGADVTHPDLESSWRGGANSWYDPYGQHPDAPVDLTGHGTAALGTIVGGDASGSSIGIAPGARWISARVFDDRGASSATAVHQAFQWVLDPDGDPATADAPQVVNGSWSLGAGPGCDLTFQPDVQALVAAGILPVFAAGNFGSGSGTSTSPANYPESLAVGALGDPTTVLASSSRGPSTCGGRSGGFPDVVAPGRDILTADRYGLYQVVSGTSIAAPQVAGVLALLLASHPGLTPAQQRAAITSGATDVGAPGPDQDTGYGRVDALAAYDLANAPDFTVTASGQATLVAGASVDVPVTVGGSGGFSGDVALETAAAGALTATVAPSVVSGGSGTVTLTVTAPRSTPAGSYEVVVTGRAGDLVRSTTIVVTVTPAPDFAVTAQPSSASVVAGGPAVFAVGVAPTSGSPGVATVTVSAPAGTTASAVPSTLPGANGTSTVTVSTSASTAPGSYPVSIDVVADGVHHVVTPTLTVVAAPSTRLEFSTLGNAKPPGLAGTADDADILAWDGAGFRRVADASAAPWSLPAAANVDGFSRLDATRFYVSFADDVKVPGLGKVQDEDVLLFDGTRWTTWFDGTARGLTSGALDLDAISVVGGSLYFSTYGVAKVPGVRGDADDADVYRWDGSAFSRVWDATAAGLPAAANVDGLDLADTTHFALSFSTTTVAVPQLGKTQDEDVVRYDGGVWSTWFDGTAAGLTTDALDVDAFDIP